MTVNDMGLYQFMPEMTDEEYQQLKQDIREKGVIVPLEFDEDGHIIDGHHRFKAFSELIEEGADIPMFDKITRKFANEMAKIDYVVALNVKRRHLTPEQRQQLVVKFRKPPFSYTMSKIATLLSISIATVSRDIDDLSEAEKAELKALTTTGADGRQYTANYAARAFYTGNTQMREQMAQDQGAAKAASQANGTQHEQEKVTRYAILVDCQSEAEQAELLERLVEEGYNVRAMVL
jgi:ParB-like chromosome segregation protein Spo0J